MISVLPIALLTLPWIQNVSFGPSPSVVQGLITWTCFALALMYASAFKVSKDHYHQIIFNAWALAALLSACMGLLQFFGFTAWLQGVVTPSELGQAFGNLRQRNQFATLMTIGLIAMLWQIQKLHSAKGMYVWALCLGIALLAAASAASGSRTGLLQWVLILGVYGFWLPQKRLFVVLALLFYVLAALLLPVAVSSGEQASGIMSRLHDTSPTCASRLTLWNNMLYLIVQKPLSGWGWGMLDYAHFVTLYPAERFCSIVDNAHNLPLQLAVELGVPIASLLCAAMLVFVFIGRPWRENNPAKQAAWAVLTATGLHSLLEYPLWYAPFQLAVILALVLILCDTTKTPVKRSLSFLLVPTLASSAIFLATIFVAFDYWRMSQMYLPLASRAQCFQTDAHKKAVSSWLFKDLALFAELTTTALTLQNAESVHANALHLLRLSPEPRVIEKILESARMLGKTEVANTYLSRYQAAFPYEAQRWIVRNGR